MEINNIVHKMTQKASLEPSIRKHKLQGNGQYLQFKDEEKREEMNRNARI